MSFYTRKAFFMRKAPYQLFQWLYKTFTEPLHALNVIFLNSVIRLNCSNIYEN